MSNSFADFDLTDFCEQSEYAAINYVSVSLTDDLIESIERELGYKLPAAYIELMKNQNGGIPKNKALPTGERTSWAEDHVAIHGILGRG